MQLTELGFDADLAAHAARLCGSGTAVARVTAVDRRRYVIRDELGEMPAALTGRFVHLANGSADLPCVGDWVCAPAHDGRARASIHGLLPRRSFLQRKSPGRDVDLQMIAANVDVAFVVQACHFDFNVRRLERYLVMARAGHVEPVVVLTKTDLVDAGVLQDMVDRIRRAGIAEPLILASAVSGAGVEDIRRLLRPGRTCCLLGSSGVGKTTLINRLAGREALATGEVSHTGEGRHTTTRRQLIVLEGGGLLIDMPGMRELGLLGAGEGLDEAFAAIRELASSCRFPDCSHSHEPGCAVRAAIAAGELAEDQLRSFVKLRRESEFHDLSHAERRRRDREFGRHVRTVLKHKDRHGGG